MIQGNCNKQKVYVHTQRVAITLLLHLGWHAVAGWADELLAEVVSSRQVVGYWFYWCWVPTPNGNRILLKRFFNFLAKKDQASALSLPARPENTPDGPFPPVRPI